MGDLGEKADTVVRKFNPIMKLLRPISKILSTGIKGVAWLFEKIRALRKHVPQVGKATLEENEDGSISKSLRESAQNVEQYVEDLNEATVQLSDIGKTAKAGIDI